MIDDKITIIEDQIEKEIYPLMEINNQNKNFLIYTTTTDKDLIEDNIYIGEITENEIKPIPEKLIPKFEQLTDQIIVKIKETQN